MKVVQFGFGALGGGGPIGAMNRLVTHRRYLDEVESRSIIQDFELGGIRPDVIARWASELRSFRPDLVHCRGLGNEGFHSVLASRVAKVPKVLLSIHGTQRDLSGDVRLRRRVVVNSIEPLSLRMATHIAGVSAWGLGREFLIDHRSKIVGYVPNGCEPGPLGTNRNDLRGRLGISSSDFVIVNVGRLSWEKGHDTLAKSLSRINPSGVVVLIVGDGPDEAAIREQYRRESSVDVRFLGRRHDVSDILRLSDLMVFPSLHENSPNVVIEAMSQGLPIVASDIPANYELLKDGVGKLFKVGDVENLAIDISSCRHNPRLLASLEERSRAAHQECYTLDSMVDGWIGIYRSVLGG